MFSDDTPPYIPSTSEPGDLIGHGLLPTGSSGEVEVVAIARTRCAQGCRVADRSLGSSTTSIEVDSLISSVGVDPRF